ncbi:MAG: DUF6122 family protein [Robiginitalea sp.]|jgi:hypothetical protein|nr:MAG: hypothetical protein JSW57_06820 [Flavobacteriaceae bacterium]
MFREFLHYGIHLLLPVVVGFLAYPGRRLKAVLILLSGLLIDLDHLLADPVFDPNRCSIGFHPLHSYTAIGVYAVLLIPSRTRIFGLALLIHILADSADCFLLSPGF